MTVVIIFIIFFLFFLLLLFLFYPGLTTTILLATPLSDKTDEWVGAFRDRCQAEED